MKFQTVALVAALAMSVACRKKAPEQPEKPKQPEVTADAGAAKEAGKAPAVDAPIVTKHLDADGKPKFTNSLAEAASWYLLRMGHSPVRFEPWSWMAFRSAEGAKRPVFLTIGYADCALCQQLATGAFDNPEVADVLNDHFKAIAVDADERPHVAAFYAEIAKSRGVHEFPLNIVATHLGDVIDVVPGPTTIGFLKKNLATLKTEQATAEENAKRLSVPPRQARSPWSMKEAKPSAVISGAVKAAKKLKEPVEPEFIRFMLRASKGDADLVNAAVDRLNQHIEQRYDVLGGGFFAPGGFEKRADENGLMLRVLTEAWQRSQNPEFERLARQTATMLLRDLVAENGAFYASARPKQPAAFRFTAEQFGDWTSVGLAIDEQGVPRRKQTLTQLAGEGEGAEALAKELDAAVGELLAERSKRAGEAQVNRTILTRANAQVIDGLAWAGFVFANSDWVNAATAAATALPAKGAALKRSGIPGRLGPDALADDYALTIRALLTAFEATASAAHFRRAALFQNQLDTRFGLAEGVYAQFPTREKDVLGAMVLRGAPVNTVTAENMARLDAFRANDFFKERREKLVGIMSAVAMPSPATYGDLLVSALASESEFRKVALVGAGTEELLDVLREGYFSNVVIGQDNPVKILPWVADKKPQGEDATAYVCTTKCSKPLTAPRELARALAR